MRSGNTSSPCSRQHQPALVVVSRGGCLTATARPRWCLWPVLHPVESSAGQGAGLRVSVELLAAAGRVGPRGVFDQLQAVLLNELDVAGRIDLERVSVDSFSLGGQRRDLTGANPLDRGKAGSKLHLAGTLMGCRSRSCSAPPTPTTPRCSRPCSTTSTDPDAHRTTASSARHRCQDAAAPARASDTWGCGG